MVHFLSFKKKLKENIADLSGEEGNNERSLRPLLPLLPNVIKASMDKNAPILPKITELFTQEDIHSFTDLSLSLMACALAERKHMTVQDYEEILVFCKEIFGEDVLDTRFQTKLHAALLRDYSTHEKRLVCIENFRRFLIENKSDLNLASPMLNSLYKALYELTLQAQRKKYNFSSRFFDEAELLFMEHKLQKKKEKLFSLSFSKNEDNEDKNSFFSFTKLPALLPQNAKNKALNVENIPFINKIIDKKALPLATQLQSEFKHEEDLQELENLALSHRNSLLLEQIKAFRSLLLPQDFRIVVLGEGKRGKSSLINALLASKLLPTKAISPETGTLIELYYSKETSYEIEWLNNSELEELEKILHTEKSNILLKKKFDNLKKLLSDKELLATLSSIKISRAEDLPDFISAEGLYTSLIKKVRIGLNSENLPKGVLLVDTPAINASDPFYHLLTKEECIKADCLVTVLDSKKPDSYSEIQLLRELAKTSRALKIVGVLTHPSKEEEEVEEAKKRALDTLKEGIKNHDEESSIAIIDVFSFNPKEVLENYEKNPSFALLTSSQQKIKFEEDYLSFVAAITQIIQENAHSTKFTKRLEATYTHLLDFAKSNREENLKLYQAQLPSNHHFELLKKHSQRLTLATEEYADHARALILSAINDLEIWRVNTERAIIMLQERVFQNISREMRDYVEELGDDFAKEDEWVEFDEEISSLIARELIDDFTQEQRADLAIWEEKFQLFTQNLEKLSVQCFSEIQKSSTHLEVLCQTNSTLDHMLIQSMKYMNRLGLFFSGAGAGLLASSGMFNMLALGSAAFAFISNPIAGPSLLILGATAFAMRAFANPAKRKALFIEKKEAKIQDFADRVAKELFTQVDTIQEELMHAYSQAVHKSLAPALEIMASEAVNLHLYLEVIEKQKKQLSID